MSFNQKFEQIPVRVVVTFTGIFSLMELCAIALYIQS